MNYMAGRGRGKQGDIRIVMKICYMYGKKKLGVLEKTEDGYVYNSDLANEQYFRDRMILTYSCKSYSLWHSANRKSRALFPEMMNVVRSCWRADILEHAKINPNDTPWERLVKLSQLKWYPNNHFYVQQFVED